MNHYTGFHYTSRDGLRLHGRQYGSRDLPGVPAICLAGLTRNSADFDVLARHLATDPESPRRVLTLDMRGRGGSERARDNAEYDVVVEATDALDGMVAAGIEDASIVGTSRGAILAMAMAAIRPGVLHAVVMNDLGPVIEAAGLDEIRRYLADAPSYESWSDAVAALRKGQGTAFPALDEAQWERFARAIYTERDGRIVPAHDAGIHRTLQAVEPGTAPPAMWTAFAGLQAVPVLSIRGELSTLFSATTQGEMGRRHPALEAYTVPGQGHAPRLDDAGTIDTIARFLARHDRR